MSWAGPSLQSLNQLSTGILAIYPNIRMDQISINTPTKIPVNSTNIETIVNSTNTENQSTLSTQILSEDCIGCGLNIKVVRELLIQHDGKLEGFPSEDRFPQRKIQPENIYLKNTTKMDHNQMTSTKIHIYPTTQFFLKIKLLTLDQNQTQFTLNTHMTI